MTQEWSEERKQRINICFVLHRTNILYVKWKGKINSNRNREVNCCDIIMEFQEDDKEFIPILLQWISGYNRNIDEDKEEGIIDKNAKELEYQQLSKYQILISNLYSYMSLWIYLEKRQMIWMTPFMYPNNLNRPKTRRLDSYCKLEKLK